MIGRTKTKERSDPGIEPGTSCTQSRNHASRPIGQLLVVAIRIHTILEYINIIKLIIMKSYLHQAGNMPLLLLGVHCTVDQSELNFFDLNILFFLCPQRKIHTCYLSRDKSTSKNLSRSLSCVKRERKLLGLASSKIRLACS
jgi:hypothetical protein